MSLLRIQKYLSQEGIASRREAERWIVAGWVRVNGEVVMELGTQIDPAQDRVTVHRPEHLAAENARVIVFHKPPDIVTNLPQGDEREIKDLLPPEFRSFNAIGRLDKDSEGLILLTNNGIVSQKLLDPKHPHSRVYEVTINKPLTDDAIDELESGIPLFGKMTLPLTVRVVNPRCIEMTMTEGKNRQIRRMIQHVGSGVVRLKRISFGPVELRNLPVGQWRELSSAELGGLVTSSV